MRDHRATWSGVPVAVTGAAGFLGSNLALRLDALGAEVRALDAFLPGSGAHPANPAGIPVRRADLREAATETVTGARVVFHLAAPAGHRASMEAPFSDYGHGVEASVRLLEAVDRTAPGARVVFTGTRQNYALPQRLPVREDDPLAPPDVHGVHKEAVEHLVRLRAAARGAGWAILRLTGCYGPRQALDGPAAGFTGQALGQALGGRPITLLGDPDLLRDFNHADDVIEALLLAGNPAAPSGLWNLGASPVRLRDFAAAIWKALGEPPRVACAPLPAALEEIAIGDVHSDWSRIEAELGWRPLRDLAGGLAETVRFFRSEPERIP